MNMAKKFFSCLSFVHTYLCYNWKVKSASFVFCIEYQYFYCLKWKFKFTCEILLLKNKVDINFRQIKWCIFSAVSVTAFTLLFHVHLRLSFLKVNLSFSFSSLGLLLLMCISSLNGIQLPKPKTSLHRSPVIIKSCWFCYN